MTSRIFVTRSEAETEALGAQLGAALSPPAWIGLVGPLGAGKTRLVQGMARGMGYEGRVRSPTFVLENRYPARTLLLHQDLYRLERADSELEAGWEENERAVIFVEWAERSGYRPERSVWIEVEPIAENERRIIVDVPVGSPVLALESLV